MKIERKDILIALAVLMFIFISIPGVIFNAAVKKYLFFLNIWSEKPITQVKNHPGKIPPVRSSYFRADLKEPELKMISFSIKTKKSGEIYLAGDFNKWKKNDIKLIKKENGSYETMIALPQGTYKYVFYIDGEKILDPYNPSLADFDGQKVSVIEVK
ncbi:MAG: hypothetical protein GX447_05535 [Elusimicrobia bacterium]|nr:hypothetical protein [Elusimicrobiota bacterium]